MRLQLFRALVCLACLVAASNAPAQFGHPLKGSWSGDWGPTKDTRNRLLLELNWDGKAITGTINPGPNAVPLQKASLDPSNWTVRFEAEARDRSGQAIRYGSSQFLGGFYRNTYNANNIQFTEYDAMYDRVHQREMLEYSEWLCCRGWGALADKNRS
jgi:hypothetical protein